MNREIPGFYYDPEKKKYFRIQASHKAAPGAQYSKDAVKRKRIEQEKNELKARQTKKIAKEKIKKASFLYHPLIGCDREIGAQNITHPVRKEHQGLVYASQMRRRVLHRFEPWPDEYSIRHALRNKRSGVLVAGGQRGGESSVSICFPDLDQDQWSYNRTMERVLFKEAYRLSSISLSHTGYLLTTMDSGPNGDSFLAPRMLPDPDEGGDYRWPSACTLPSHLPLHPRKELTVPVTHPIRILTSTTYWSSASCPTPIGPKPLFAIGTSDGLQILTGQGSHWSLSKAPFPDDRGHWRSQVNAVEWLSGDVIAAGCRDSSVFLHDLRSGGSAVRLWHPGAVAVGGVRRVDEWRVVVGSYNSLQMYDLRYPPTHQPNATSNPNHRPGHSNSRNKNKRKHNQTNYNSRTSTKPYLVLPEYSPPYTPEYDLSTELGLLASVSDEDKIQLFSLRSGELVSPYTSPVCRYEHNRPISSVRFEDGDASAKGPQTPGLLVTAGDRVDEWLW
ncbi:uncharacterized protein ASPGLDRAFT_23900 [Aspergillus glaucus CBS 516.65]|uniref:Myocyte-specific enhancer factor 2d n=1 Tax=Aspergillus glaucus CBS 516.65 TaxID=1160497 RepID=A0A1L9VS57_ASPGL|nr:hypothetical protein ASPGLDRAFT_23900 [Aspergillus glaucus CBS 516.65]OJJ86746.1 hypothetical protein ASPGLDRAFT_23900 [Aspergillus glaucus CBS 516.65]